MTDNADLAWTLSHIITLPNGGTISQGGYYSIPVVGFDSVYYCAVEHPPPEDMRGGVVYATNYYAPNNDSENLSLAKEMRRAGLAAANVIARHVNHGKRCLVTCAVGKNRSGLATGLALRKLGLGGQEAVELIRTQRPGALSNELFVRMILEY